MIPLSAQADPIWPDGTFNCIIRQKIWEMVASLSNLVNLFSHHHVLFWYVMFSLRTQCNTVYFLLFPTYVNLECQCMDSTILVSIITGSLCQLFPFLPIQYSIVFHCTVQYHRIKIELLQERKNTKRQIVFFRHICFRHLRNWHRRGRSRIQLFGRFVLFLVWLLISVLNWIFLALSIFILSETLTISNSHLPPSLASVLTAHLHITFGLATTPPTLPEPEADLRGRPATEAANESQRETVCLWLYLFDKKYIKLHESWASSNASQSEFFLFF